MRWRKTDGTDGLAEVHLLRQPQQRDVIVVVVGLEAWMEEDFLHRAIGGQMFVSSVMEAEENLEDTYWSHWSYWSYWSYWSNPLKVNQDTVGSCCVVWTASDLCPQHVQSTFRVCVHDRKKTH